MGHYTNCSIFNLQNNNLVFSVFLHIKNRFNDKLEIIRKLVQFLFVTLE